MTEHVLLGGRAAVVAALVPTGKDTEPLSGTEVRARLERLEAKLDKIPTPETVMVNGTLVPKVANIVDVTLKPAIFHGEDRELLERIEAKLDRLLKREA